MPSAPSAVAAERPDPAFEQAARPVEQQEGDEERPEREQEAGGKPHRGEAADRAGEEEDARAAEREAVKAGAGGADGVGRPHWLGGWRGAVAGGSPAPKRRAATKCRSA